MTGILIRILYYNYISNSFYKLKNPKEKPVAEKATPSARAYKDW